MIIDAKRTSLICGMQVNGTRDTFTFDDAGVADKKFTALQNAKNPVAEGSNEPASPKYKWVIWYTAGQMRKFRTI